MLVRLLQQVEFSRNYWATGAPSGGKFKIQLSQSFSDFSVLQCIAIHKITDILSFVTEKFSSLDMTAQVMNSLNLEKGNLT